MREMIIGPSEENQRLDKYLMKYLNNSPRSFIYKMLRKKNIKLNEAKAQGTEILKNGDRIKIFFSEDTFNEFTQEKKINLKAGNIEAVYEDENILICNKPVGLLSHPEKPMEQDGDTLVDRILAYLAKKNAFDISKASTFTPALCNRLDRNTSGIVVCGKNLPTVQGLNHAIAERKVDKYYLTIVKGEVKEQGVLVGYHSKDRERNNAEISSKMKEGSKRVVTEFEPLKSSNGYTLLKIKLVTGKSHQIRAHLASINHPIVGDTKYGDRKVNEILKTKLNINHQLLHSEKIFFQETEGVMQYLCGKEFKAAVPDTFPAVVRFLMKTGF